MKTIYRIVFHMDVEDFVGQISWLRVNETEVYCQRGVRRERAAATRIRGDGRHFEGVYEALCVTRWKNDPPFGGLQHSLPSSPISTSSEILIHRLYTNEIHGDQLYVKTAFLFFEILQRSDYDKIDSDLLCDL